MSKKRIQDRSKYSLLQEIEDKTQEIGRLQQKIIKMRKKLTEAGLK